MDFFDHQRQAKRNTRYLALLFGALVMLITITLYIAISLFIDLFITESLNTKQDFLVGAIVAGLTTLTLALAVRRRIKQLEKAGVRKLITRLKAHQLSALPADADKRMLQNVVEEMAVAAGLPVPWVYVLEDEPGINALTVGFDDSDAAVLVTWGAVKNLERAELQALIGHEMSHLLYSDTRLNMYLLAILDGLSDLANAGRWLLFWPLLAPESDTGKRFLVLLILTSAIFLFIGYSSAGLTALRFMVLPLIGILGGVVACITGIGFFFSRLVQRTLTRQREMLADAAAVQFTRDPSSLAGLFQKIKSAQVGSQLFIETSRVDHFFFAASTKTLYLTDLLASHPPLRKRLKQLSPSAVAAARSRKESAPEPTPQKPKEVLNHMGTPTDAHLQRSRQLLEQLSPSLKDLTRDLQDAQMLVSGLLLDTDSAVQSSQRQLIRRNSFPGATETLDHVQNEIVNLPSDLHLPLIELSLSALRQMDKADKKRFVQLISQLIRANKKISLFEFSMYKLLEHWLRPSKQGTSPHLNDPNVIAPDVQLLLSALALLGHDAKRDAHRAFRIACSTLSYGDRLSLLPPDRINYEKLNEAVDRLKSTSNRLRRDIIQAVSRSTLDDKRVTIEEAALTRIVAVLFDCPLPPFLLQLNS